MKVHVLAVHPLTQPVTLPSALYHSFPKLEFRASSTTQNAPEKSVTMADPLRGAFSVVLCLFPEVPLPALLADGFCLGFPGAEGAFADAGFAGKGGTAEARPLSEGQNLPGLSVIEKAVVPVQQVSHRHAVQFRQPVRDGGGGILAGAGL